MINRCAKMYKGRHVAALHRKLDATPPSVEKPGVSPVANWDRWQRAGHLARDEWQNEDSEIWKSCLMEFEPEGKPKRERYESSQGFWNQESKKREWEREMKSSRRKSNKGKENRARWGLNPCGNFPMDFKSIALTTRPQAQYRCGHYILIYRQDSVKYFKKNIPSTRTWQNPVCKRRCIFFSLPS